jgi:hypothetical protein
VHTDAFERARTGLVGRLISKFLEQLRREALHETGLHLSDAGSLSAFAERLIERSSVVGDNESGNLFRASIEDTNWPVAGVTTSSRHGPHLVEQHPAQLEFPGGLQPELRALVRLRQYSRCSRR